MESVSLDRFVPVARRPAPWRVIPDASAHLIVHLYEPAARIVGRAAYRCRLVGPRSVYADVDQRGRSRTLVLTLRPGALAALAGMPADELADHALDPRDLWPAEYDELLEEALAPALDPALDPAAQIRALAALLRRRARAAAPPAPAALLAALGVARRCAGRCTVDAVAAHVGVSGRHLRALFLRHVGLPPKRVLRIARVREVIARMSGANGDWARRAADHGYFDQAHLIHDFEALLGESPERFRERCVREG
ncbi:MAG TPA: helix-turn-helix domain-containing protein [Gemmatimonadaceae bacterium]|nr:helix-turn-helix domain-containing protein [Gemmatimonadaceae bacterium]